MTKSIKGIYTCEKDGEFEWEYHFSNKGFSGKMNFSSKHSLNCKKCNDFDNYYIFELECPECYRRYYIEKVKDAKE